MVRWPACRLVVRLWRGRRGLQTPQIWGRGRGRGQLLRLPTVGSRSSLVLLTRLQVHRCSCEWCAPVCSQQTCMQHALLVLLAGQ